MAIREIKKFFSNKGTRNEVRMRLVKVFSREDPGTGRGDNASKYIYYVESLASNNRVYLKRPANLHNGFDFLVCVENVNYAPEGKKRRNYPKHTDFSADLQLKKQENPEMYAQLYSLLKKVFECQDVTKNEYANINFDIGFPVEHILKVIKWLFIEQDIRYWNYSGRNMMWGLIPEPEA